MILYMYLNEIYFYLNYDLIYMIFRQSDYVLIQIPSQWGLFIGTNLVLSGASRVYRVFGPS